MTNQSKTLIFFGNERLATGVTTRAPILEGLLANGYTVDLLVVNQAAQSGRHKRALEVENLAELHGIEIYRPENNTELVAKINQSPATFAVLAAFGKIVPQVVIDVFDSGIINIHPSNLPKLRGTTPIETAMIQGLNQTAVSLMQLAEAMDAGPVYAQSLIDIEPQISKQDLADKLAKVGSELLIKHLPEILSGELKPTPQVESEASYTKLIDKADGLISWDEPAEIVERKIRAYWGWPGSRTRLGDREVIITEAAVADKHGQPGQISVVDKRLIVHCQEQSIEILFLKPLGKNEMSAQAFLAGNLLD